jgi:hypothetical protein
MSTSDIVEMTIIPMLVSVFNGDVPIDSTSLKKKEVNETNRGNVTSIVSRRLFTVRNILVKHIDNLVQEHDALHNAGHVQSTHDCESFVNKMMHVRLRKEILDGLLWQSLVEENPWVATNNVAVRRGWVLTGLDEQWNNDVPLSDKSILAKSFVSLVTAFVRGTVEDVDEDRLGQSLPGEEVVGSLNDGRVQSFFNLYDKVRNEYIGQLPEPIRNGDFEQFSSMGVRERIRLSLLGSYYGRLLELTSSLFWCGVRDTVPDASNILNIDIRRAWDVVKCVPNKSDPEIELIMTPKGPVLALKIFGPED